MAETKTREWPRFLVFIGGEFVAAAIVRASHATGLGAWVLYLAPVFLLGWALGIFD